MIKKPLTVTIGIPAHNEEANIGKLLVSLLSQRQIGWKLDKIIVVSDASTDKTSVLVKHFNDRRIKLIDDGRRLGKPGRINQLFNQETSDVVVIIDADIMISSTSIISELIAPMKHSSKVQLVSGNASPAKPTTFAQKVGYAGVMIWYLARKLAPQSDMYFCEGPIRAFGKKLYKDMTFPLASADDAFAYIYAKKRGFQFHYAEKAAIYFKLPATYLDYTKQYSRILQSSDIQENNFDKMAVETYYTVSRKIKLRSLAIKLVRDPFWTSCYLLFILRPKIEKVFRRYKDQAAWDIVRSTKNYA